MLQLNTDSGRFSQQIALKVLGVSSSDGVEDWQERYRLPRHIRLEVASSPGEALGRLRGCAYDAILAEFPLAQWTPAELLEEAKRIDPSLHFLVVQSGCAPQDAIRLVKLGAQHVFADGPSPEELAREMEAIAESRRTRDVAALMSALEGEPWRRLLVGNSPALNRVCEIVRLVGPRRSTVLITGETGTGKEMVARALHLAGGDRAGQPLVSVNCSAIPETLLEAELFGHVKGAFTGAAAARTGRFEQADHGTIFFDEIGDMPMDLQAKLLRVLQEREFQRIGASETVKVDVRVVAATNVCLAERVSQGKFREDLYYRLNVVPVRTPPLRERPQDIPLLVEHFLDKICRFEKIPTRQVTRETLDRLDEYSWPGNVRQLENAVEMAVVLSGERKLLYPSDFPIPSAGAPAHAVELGAAPLVPVPDEGLDFERTVNAIERSILQQALEKTSGNKKQAADMLKLKRTTLSAKLRVLEATA